MVLNTKIFGLVALAMIVLAFVPAFAAANSDLDIQYLKINDEQVNTYNQTDKLWEVERGDTLPIRLRISALADVKDVQITAGIYGYQYSQYDGDSLIQTTKTFDLDESHEKTVDLTLQVPVKMAVGNYKLRIFVADQDSLSYTAQYNLAIKGIADEKAVVIKEAYLNPGDEVMAGRGLSALVKVENMGDNPIDDATLIVSVPELGIRDTETLDELGVDEKETFERVMLYFPKDTKAGTYNVEYKVTFDEFQSTTKTGYVTVSPCKSTVCGAAPAVKDDQKTFITVPNSQPVVQGNEIVYPVMINNAGNSAKAYALSVQGIESWGTARIDPSASVIVPAGNSGTVFLHLTANQDAPIGEQYFKISVVSDGTSKDIPLTAIVGAQVADDDATSWNGLKKTLEIGLIVLVIILILIGLIVGFNKLRGSDNDDDDSKTYY